MSQFAPAVLIVDDDDAVRRTLVQLLSSRGYRVLEASDGDEAWSLLQTEPLDIVISDLQMPKCDGRELCQRIREEPSLSDLRIVIISGSLEALDPGQLRCDRVLIKPIPVAELLDEVGRAARKIPLASAPAESEPRSL
jgi:CheY-like chemotaxis protein